MEIGLLVVTYTRSYLHARGDAEQRIALASRPANGARAGSPFDVCLRSDLMATAEAVATPSDVGDLLCLIVRPLSPHSLSYKRRAR